MRRIFKTGFTTALVAGVALSTTACQDFMTVRTPNVIAAETLDPVQDAAVLSNSAWQNFVASYGWTATYAAWFTNELRVGDTFPTRNQFGMRFIDDTNSSANGDVWVPVQRAIASAEESLRLLDELPESNINITRLYLTSGFTTLVMAETFCTGVVRKGIDADAPELTTAQMLDHAIERFDQAIASGVANGTATGTAMANAARVGKARALLFGNRAGVAAAVADVPDDFVFNAVYFDDPGSRVRLGNGVFYFSGRTALRESGVVGPEWMEIGAGEDISDAQTFADLVDGDPRLQWRYAGREAQDGVHAFVYQDRHASWAAPLVVASGLEARYLEAEVGTDADRLALINERRAEFGHDLFVSADSDAIMEEFLFQKGMDFWLTARRMGDWRRNPDHVRFILESGSSYYKDVLDGLVHGQTCFPLPWQEYSRNDAIDRDT